VSFGVDADLGTDADFGVDADLRVMIPIIPLTAASTSSPAGGNPCFKIAVHNGDALNALGKFYWG
jgi:hypothetical protein